MDYVEEMKKLINGLYGDVESDHLNADNLIIDFLNANGFTELSDAYAAVEKWYA